MAIRDKKVLLVVAPNDFAGEDYDIARRVLEVNGAKVTVASTHLGFLRSKSGVVLKVDILVDDVKTWDYDGAIFIGGEGGREFFQHEKVHKLAKDMEGNKVLGAIGDATIVFANAGIVSGKKITGAQTAAGLLREKGAVYTGREIEVEGKMVTIRSPQFVYQFINAFTDLLARGRD